MQEGKLLDQFNDLKRKRKEILYPRQIQKFATDLKSLTDKVKTSLIESGLALESDESKFFHLNKSIQKIITIDENKKAKERESILTEVMEVLHLDFNNLEGLIKRLEQ